jgi:hypothetical protein
MSMIEPEIPEQLILTLFKNTVTVQPDQKLDNISFDNLTQLILKYKLGGFGKGIMVDYLNN